VGFVVLGEDRLGDHPVAVASFGCPSGLLTIETLAISIHEATQTRGKPARIKHMRENSE
jgi:hypothetical protein